MEARMKTIAAGPDINVGPGQVVTGERAAEFAAAGYAEKIAAPETASIAPTEAAVMPAAGPRDPLDHDGNGDKGGSPAGAEATAAKGAARKRARGK